MRKAAHTKGIFCVEGLWDPDLKVRSSVRPLLELLQQVAGINYIHRNCATGQELEFYLGKWVQKKYKAYPILYVASHGVEYAITLGAESYSLDDLAGVLEGQCANRLIMMSSCSTLGIDKRYLKRFLERTEALAVCGYRTDVDWLRSAAFELLLLSE
ncbi:MAG: hypothetical protein JW850_14275, partial [Thermoflexales bacterium]|nr:hypothetical protein [Thermoflexales bacterium]